MATSKIIEEETGTSTGCLHPHNRYWAGDFTSHATSQPTRVLSADLRRQHSMTTAEQVPVWRLR